jgi:peroxiredoxin
VLRAVFISAFTTYLGVSFIFAVIHLIRQQTPVLSWLGLALAAAAPIAFLACLYLARPARTARHPVAVSLVCGLGLAITMMMNRRFGASSGAVHIWAGICLIGWFAYLRWYSVFPSRNSPCLTAGEDLPEFELTSLSGETVNSKSFRGSNYVWLFYRGNWCPLCSAQIAELAGEYRTLQELGTEVVLISSQAQQHSLRLARKFRAPMQFFQDNDNAAAKTLGILAQWGTPMGLQLLAYPNDTAMPTVIISDAEGKILYADQTDNYRVRPEPETFLKILRKHSI